MTVIDGTAGGPEWRLEADGYEAVVMAVGASLRQLRRHGHDLVVPFGAAEIRPVYRGATVAPWPNRIADGRYTFHGIAHQLPINEVERGHALHGLVHWVRWELVEVAADRLVLAHDLVPQDGYPFALRLRASFEVGAGGLTTRLTAINIGTEAAPYGCCPHPYLMPGAGPVDGWELTLPAGRRVAIDERLLPLEEEPVDDTDCDFRVGELIGHRQIDHAFTDLTRGADGRAAVRVLDPATGRGVELSWGAWAEWVQIHTADRPEPALDRVGLAVEPMSCPPNAFNDQGGPPVLESGATHDAEWTISATG